MRWFAALVASALLLGACSEDRRFVTVSTTTVPPSTVVSTTTSTTAAATTVTTTTSAAPTTAPVPSDTTAPGDQVTRVGDAASPPSPGGILDDLDATTIQIDDRELLVAVADSPALRSTGLMGVTDLGSIDGMLFVYQSDSSSGFWMRNTLIPLDIVFFAEDGSHVDGFRMEPCFTAQCPTYRPASIYRYALEAEAGSLEWVTPSSVLELDG